ncbi:phasin family protein [Microvirga puerhi]|uniref:Phasin family protein n=1 Tax=Microvirga puerhi TaxID=2876078 RepID=A0ABS7VSL1_9HYPH|nr:phasin family protein [Microvirga puerhi]MBZ6077977.1 phasin family protein [Microvirga puerhi]
MITNRRFSQTPPDRANELFEKLLATSENAVKTRERLFSDLKEELELLASLQEQHLFPVLWKHGMRDLVQQAIDDNRETNALLAELERMPKNSVEFHTQVAELRGVFQQHIRDDKKELLPAVLKVLSDEEAEAVVDKVEDDMATVEETKQAEVRRGREQVETLQRVTDDVADTTMRVGLEGAQTVARTLQDAVQSSFGAASELARRSTGPVTQALGLSAGNAQGLAEQASQNLQAVAQSGTVLARGIQEVSRQCLELSQKRWQKNLEGLNALTRCHSMTDFFSVQASMFHDNLEQTIENSRRIAELTRQVAEETARTVTVQAEKTASRAGRAA